MANNDNTTKKIALVTGASSGIGYELAKEFARNNYNLIICAEDSNGLTQAANNLRAETGAMVEAVTADLSTREGVEKLYQASKSVGPVEALAANAGIGTYGNFTTGNDARDTDLDTELKMIDLNTKSVVHLTKLISKDMVARGSGKILITASVVSFAPDSYQTVYAATKAFDYMFAEGLRQHLKDTGVTVTALLPGATDTNFFARAGATDSKVYDKSNNGEKLANPADVAKVAVKALENGDDHVVHGFMNKVMVGISSIAPTPVAAKMNEMQMEPADKKKAG